MTVAIVMAISHQSGVSLHTLVIGCQHVVAAEVVHDVSVLIVVVPVLYHLFIMLNHVVTLKYTGHTQLSYITSSYLSTTL